MSRKLLAGYWHNFANQAGIIPLGDVPDAYDIVNIAFATPAFDSTAAIQFSVVDGYGESPFAADVRRLQKRGKKVLLSIGGAEATIQLKNKEDVRIFVRSVAQLVERYGFDGIDIDFEGHSLFLDNGDIDLFQPTTAVVVNLITALQTLRTQLGERIILGMAPETFFVQQGFTRYGADGVVADNRGGCALPVIAALRDVISCLWVQHYNSGPIKALDGKLYGVGDRDFHVAMAEMILAGFSIASACGSFVAPFDAGQVFIGIPASKEAGTGFLESQAIRQVLAYLITGKDFCGSYKLLNSEGYAGLRGVMVWSINWDMHAGCKISKNIRDCLDSLGAA